jgi:hypothetical protein
MIASNRSVLMVPVSPAALTALRTMAEKRERSGRTVPSLGELAGELLERECGDATPVYDPTVLGRQPSHGAR